MAYYGLYMASAGWVVPKKYVEKVGDEGFKKAPVGAGPIASCRFTRASNWCWRRSISTGARSRASSAWSSEIPDPSTQLAALKRGEIDLVFSVVSELADEARRTPGVVLKPVYPSVHWVSFPEQWDPRSPIAGCGWPPTWPST